MPNPTIELIRHDIRPRRVLALPFPLGGLILTVATFDVVTGWRLVEEERKINEPLTLYLGASRKFGGYSYRLELDEETGFFRCRCLEFVSTRLGFCAHTTALEQLV